MDDLIRVLVVDDSAFMRYTVAKYLATDPDIDVVGSARDGVDALSKVSSLKPDVVTLDVEMPKMDGLTALKHIMAKQPTPVVMLSSLTQKGTRTTIRALMRGAVDFVAKPSAKANTRTVMKELISKVKAASGVRSSSSTLTYTEQSRSKQKSVGLRPFNKGDPLVIIGTSTGGPRALQDVLSSLPANLVAAVLVVQHMPAGFTRSLASRLNEISPLTIQEAIGGDRLAQGLVLLAPGDYHLVFKDYKRVTLNRGPRRRHVHPSTDVTMESAVRFHGSSLIGVILTGMGSDGTDGARMIKQVGGRIIAQDKSTSVVYGMPRSVVEAGLADRVVPLSAIASTLADFLK